MIGNRLALGVRLCGDELIEGGTTIDDAVEVARMVEATGQVDYINTSIGVATASLFMIEASMHIPPGYAMFIPCAIRKAVDLPVVGVGRFKDPLQAERALAEGHCDLVGVVRGQIADADFAAKARAGATDDIRLCLSLQPGVRRPDGPQPLARLHREPENRRKRGRASARSQAREPQQTCGSPQTSPARPASWWSAPARGAAGGDLGGRHGHRVTVYEQERQPAGRCGWRPACPTVPSSAT